MSMYKALSGSPMIPWRLRQGMERWLESSCRDRRPGLYRWLHFGDARDRLRAVTVGPEASFLRLLRQVPVERFGKSPARA